MSDGLSWLASLICPHGYKYDGVNCPTCNQLKLEKKAKLLEQRKVELRAMLEEKNKNELIDIIVQKGE